MQEPQTLTAETGKVRRDVPAQWILQLLEETLLDYLQPLSFMTDDGRRTMHRMR